LFWLGGIELSPDKKTTVATPTEVALLIPHALNITPATTLVINLEDITVVGM
jgi:hypothetical protein